MRLFILSVLFTLSSGVKRHPFGENSALSTKPKFSDKNPGLELPCGEHFVPLKQKFFISSDTAPNHCQWKFVVPANNVVVKIRCNVRLRQSNNCKDASLRIFDGWRSKHKYCGRRQDVVSRSATGIMIVTAKAQTRKFTSEELGTFSCEVSSELSVNFFVKLPEKQLTTPSPLPPPLLLLERILAYMTSDPND
ncbi:uncharacterized protein LOC135225006 [Macrobrachium nipponense]|uniref:uncharacterized protein LOC135225006 n=1 Tax=Macrobrachium nipponense TaxID=159736 RepID=UPI0030C7B699